MGINFVVDIRREERQPTHQEKDRALSLGTAKINQLIRTASV